MVDPYQRKLKCHNCPKGLYSVGGGGILIDGRMGDWLAPNSERGGSMPLRMSHTCSVFDLTENTHFEKNRYCTPWTTTGFSLKASKGELHNTIVEYDLTYAVYFDTEGYVEFKYRKDGGDEMLE